MTHNMLRRCVRAFGGTTALAEALGEYPQTMRHWIAGRRPPPDDIAARVVPLLRTRARSYSEQAATCTELADAIEGPPPAEEPRPLSWGGEAAE